jgi:hypothetical protein
MGQAWIVTQVFAGEIASNSQIDATCFRPHLIVPAILLDTDRPMPADTPFDCFTLNAQVMNGAQMCY